jgi:hypothetical protein
LARFPRLPNWGSICRALTQDAGFLLSHAAKFSLQPYHPMAMGSAARGTSGSSRNFTRLEALQHQAVHLAILSLVQVAATPGFMMRPPECLPLLRGPHDRPLAHSTSLPRQTSPWNTDRNQAAAAKDAYPGSLIDAAQIPVHVRKFAVLALLNPCSKTDELIAKGPPNRAYRVRRAIKLPTNQQRSLLNSLLPGNFDQETGSRQTASTASHPYALLSRGGF